MDKINIKSKLKTLLDEADKKPIGKTATEKVQKKEKSVNNDYYKEVAKKMKKYDSDSKSNNDSVKSGDLEKYDLKGDDEKVHDEVEINNGTQMNQYDNEPSKKFKERAKEALTGSAKMGNQTYKGKWNPKTGAGNGNTEEVWGSSGGKHTGEEILKNVKSANKNYKQYQEDDIESLPKVEPKKHSAYNESVESNNEIINKNKMKRLRFKKPFNGLGKALTLIPESYRVDDKVFEMTDGNENYKIRWEGSVNEGQAIVIQASDNKLMNEDIQQMKHLMSFKAESTLGTPSSKERVNEDSSFRDIMNLSSRILEGKEDGDKKPIIESAFAGFGFTGESNLEETDTVTEEEVTESDEVSESKGEAANVPQENKIDSNVGDTTQSNGRKPTDSGGDPHIMEDEKVTEGEEITEEEEVTESEEVMEGFEDPTVFSISEGELTQSMSSGEDLGTEVGKTASGDPRGEGHDKEIMAETEEVVEGEEIKEEEIAEETEEK